MVMTSTLSRQSNENMKSPFSQGVSHKRHSQNAITAIKRRTATNTFNPSRKLCDIVKQRHSVPKDFRKFKTLLLWLS